MRGGLDRYLSRIIDEEDELVHEDGWDEARKTIHASVVQKRSEKDEK